MKNFPFKVVEGLDDKPMVNVTFKEKEKKFTPE
jgi:hypothetical protein